MDTLLARIAGADHQTVGGVEIDTVRAGNGRVKRLLYPPGFRWSRRSNGTDRHVGGVR